MLVVLACMVLLGSVSATDVSVDVSNLTSSDSDDVISQDPTQDILTATGSFTELNTIIYGKTGTINLTKNYTYNSGDSALKDGIKITNDNVIIDGKGYTIDASNSARVFEITGNNVVLKNIIIKNAQTTNNINHNKTSYSNTNFTMGNGAGILWTGDYGVLNNTIITNSKITNTITFYNTTDSYVNYIIGNGAGIYVS